MFDEMTEKEELQLVDASVGQMASWEWAVHISGEQPGSSAAREPPKRSIYKVPDFLAQANPVAYQPQVVYFGPYRGEKKLATMESHKSSILDHVLRRTRRTHQEFRDALAGSLEEAMQSYDQVDAKLEWTKESALKMMVLDGCFLLEVLQSSKKPLSGYKEDHPVFGSNWEIYLMPYIKRDMLLVENQLPLVVLEKLMAAQGGPQAADVEDLIREFYGCTDEPAVRPTPEQRPRVRGLHVLDVYRRAMLGDGEFRGGFAPYPAVMLNDSGVHLRSSQSSRFKEVRFEAGALCGTLHLPRFLLDLNTEPTLLNFMVFEMLHGGAGNEVTSYVGFMASLVASEQDAALLQRRGIVLCRVGDHRAVVDFFRRVATVVPALELGDPQAERKTFPEMGEVKMHPWGHFLMKNFVRGQWMTWLSIVLTLYALAFTVIQTLYSVRSYNLQLLQQGPPPR